MQHLLLALLIQAGSLHEEPLNPRTIGLKGPVGVSLSRGYFEKADGKWVEDHRNEIERAMYDAKGNLIGIIEVGLLDSVVRYKNVEDAQGRVTETTMATPGSVQGKRRVTYNAAGQLDTAELFDGSGELIERAAYSYSKRGKLAEVQYFGKEKKADGLPLSWKATYSYSADGKQVKRTTYDMFPKERVDNVAILDEKGDVQSVIEYDEWGKGKEFVYEYERNEAGFWTKQLKLKKVGEKDTIPVDVYYRAVTAIQTKAD